MTEIRPLDPACFQEARVLLEDAALPVADLRPAALPAFFAAWDEGRLAGVVAVEPLGREGLLRSLAVRPESRGRGTGRRLVAAAEAHARERGIQVLYLLTTTAEGFFARAGYRRLSRTEAPASVRGTAEFRTVCPATATLMGKRVG
ncbi:MAG TPA: arsenic resistance N-acetyltransferase ArsN2 [Gemmatimonadales bacterium]|nr:arsenic resistance N-acetyltransferase ArsN2 [Gemmatimonadales bacterium]